MRIAVAGEPEQVARLAGMLGDAGFEVGALTVEARQTQSGSDGSGSDESGGDALASQLIAFERSLDAQRPQAVVVVDDSDAGLAAVLVASKLSIPVASTPPAGQPAGLNGRLIARLCDAALPAQPAAIGDWIAGGVASPTLESAR